MSPWEGWTNKARTDGACRSCMARQVEWGISVCKTPRGMTMVEQAPSNGSYNYYDSFANLSPQSAPTDCVWATGSRYRFSPSSPHIARSAPPHIHHRLGERAPFKCAGPMKRGRIYWSPKSSLLAACYLHIQGRLPLLCWSEKVWSRGSESFDFLTQNQTYSVEGGI